MPVPSASTNTTIATISSTIDAARTGRRPMWSDTDPTVRSAPTRAMTYTANTTVSVKDEKPNTC